MIIGYVCVLYLHLLDLSLHVFCARASGPRLEVIVPKTKKKTRGRKKAQQGTSAGSDKQIKMKLIESWRIEIVIYIFSYLLSFGIFLGFFFLSRLIRPLCGKWILKLGRLRAMRGVGGFGGLCGTSAIHLSIFATQCPPPKNWNYFVT